MTIRVPDCDDPWETPPQLTFTVLEGRLCIHSGLTSQSVVLGHQLVSVREFCTWLDVAIVTEKSLLVYLRFFRFLALYILRGKGTQIWWDNPEREAKPSALAAFQMGPYWS